jgi:hypothetical protein
MIATNGCGLPTCIVSGRIGGIKLEFVVFVITCKQKCGTKGSGSTDLSVVLFDVANVNDDFFDWYIGSILELVVLS